MKQLTVGVLKLALQNEPDDELIFLGDDEELNGIHGAYFVGRHDADEMEDMSQGTCNKSGFLIS